MLSSSFWIDDVNKEDPEMRVHRFSRVVCGISSPFLLNATVKYHLERFLDSNGATVKPLLWSTYVDDIISGADSDEEAFELYTQAKEIFRQGGFNLSIDSTEGLPNSVAFTSTTQEVKVLGITWNPQNDTLIFDLSSGVQSTANKRGTW